MQEKNTGKVTIHTTLIPDQQSETPNEQPILWRVLPHPKARKRHLPARTTVHARAKTMRERKKAVQPGKRLTAGEKLLRNAAVACSLLLVVMALSNVNQPWTQQATEGIRRAVTMRIDLDESLGRLSFVRQLMPEAALVFWNMGSGADFRQPVSGTITHAYSDQQPWLMYQCRSQQPVYAAREGTVSAIGQGADGEWTLMLDHDDGEQTVYAYLGQAIVKVGQQLQAGAQLGVTDEGEDARLYFELRKNGQSQNPTSRMADA